MEKLSIPKKRILVTGSRGWSDPDIIRGTLTGLINSSGWRNCDVAIVHGDCKDGADALTKAVITNLRQMPPALIKLEDHPATDMHPLARNSLMVSLGADVCVGFLLQCHKAQCHRKPKGHGTHGSEDTLAKARAAHIETIVVRGGQWF